MYIANRSLPVNKKLRSAPQYSCSSSSKTYVLAWYLSLGSTHEDMLLSPVDRGYQIDPVALSEQCQKLKPAMRAYLAKRRPPVSTELPAGVHASLWALATANSDIVLSQTHAQELIDFIRQQPTATIV